MRHRHDDDGLKLSCNEPPLLLFFFSKLPITAAKEEEEDGRYQRNIAPVLVEVSTVQVREGMQTSCASARTDKGDVERSPGRTQTAGRTDPMESWGKAMVEVKKVVWEKGHCFPTLHGPGGRRRRRRLR